MFQRGRVNMIVTQQTIRYAYQKQVGVDSKSEYGELELPDDTMKGGDIQDVNLFKQAVSKLVAKKRWKRKKLAFCLVDDTVFIQTFELPGTLDESEALSYIRIHHGYTIEIPFENPALSVDILKHDNNKTDVRVYAYPQGKIDRLSEAFRACGLEPIIADLTFLSVYRYYAKSLPKTSTNVLLIHWNRRSIDFTVFNRSKPVFNRHIRTNIPDVMTKENIDPIVNDYVTEIYRLIEFYYTTVAKTRATFNEFIITGDFQRLDLARDALTIGLGLKAYDFPNRAEVSAHIREFDGGSYGRSTRVTSTELELLTDEDLNHDNMLLSKYIDLFGLGFKSE